MKEMQIIPKPERVKLSHGEFAFEPKTTIFASTDFLPAANHLAQALAQATGVVFDVKQSEQRTSAAGAICLRQDARRSELGDEGYALSVNADGVVVRAFRPAGAFYACQTLRQMLPAPGKGGVPGPRTLPLADIEDRPRFPWRGFMLDSSRHFQDGAFVRRLLDALAFYKINRLHWHLCDSQGWRIEIDKYPGLTTAADGGKYDFYSKQEIREILDYAAMRHVLVYPEVEMPGHSFWPLDVFKELRCENAEPPFNEYCLGSEKTVLFFENVLREVMDLFPGAIIHLGGDEADPGHWRKCPRCQARIRENGLENEFMLQKWFMQKMADFVHAAGRESIAWAERQELGWPAGQVVQGWHPGESDKALAQGLRTVNSNDGFVYFDYPISPDDPMQAKWMPQLPLQKVYSFDPVPAGTDPGRAALVLGSEACLWTENIPQEKVFEKTFPRLLAFSEAVWSPAAARDWDCFRARAAAHSLLLDAMGISHFPL